jgi:hypothetical protein
MGRIGRTFSCATTLAASRAGIGTLFSKAAREARVNLRSLRRNRKAGDATLFGDSLSPDSGALRQLRAIRSQMAVPLLPRRTDSNAFSAAFRQVPEIPGRAEKDRDLGPSTQYPCPSPFFRQFRVQRCSAVHSLERKLATFSTARCNPADVVSCVVPALCGLSTTFVIDSSGSFAPIGSSWKTSSAAPAMR